MTIGTVGIGARLTGVSLFNVGLSASTLKLRIVTVSSLESYTLKSREAA
jgi:hypothetical protein